jgi:uncharacterized protein YbbK (DUF523 family)
MSQTKILISACLLGDSVRYDGNHKLLAQPIIQQWSEAGFLLKQCPEVSGGLPIPRLPAEIQTDKNHRIAVKNIQGEDVTQAFLQGAKNTLALCVKHHIKMAILTEGSPSCGSSQINDGQFSGTKIHGQGVTTQLLTRNNIKVFSHLQLTQAQQYFEQYLLLE